MRSYAEEFTDFENYCNTLTETQLIAVIHKEREAQLTDSTREPHFVAAMAVASRRKIDWRK